LSRSRAVAFVIGELSEVLAPTLLFEVGFNLIEMTTQLVLGEYLVRFANFMVVPTARHRSAVPAGRDRPERSRMTHNKLQACKRRRAGRPPFWTGNRIAMLRKHWGTARMRRSLESWVSPTLRFSIRRAGSRRLNAWPRNRIATLHALQRKGL
jgi:hypothetical protein